MTKVSLYDINMNKILLRGVKWLEFVPEPVSVEPFTEKVYNGEIDLGSSTNARRINARFSYEAGDFLDYKLLRNQLYRVFNPLNKMWVVDEDVPGIKWLVKIESYQPERINGTLAEVALVFKSSKTYSRSIGTSLDPFTYDANLWGYSMGLKRDATAQQYIHKETWFSIYNPGDVEVDPREDELKITLRSITATGSDIRITNETTGDVWRYRGIFQAGDLIVLEGVTVRRNGLNVIKNTAPDFGLISLATGENDFTITGITGEFEIKFEFPFLYL